MHIDFVEISNFRKLSAVRIDFARQTTLLVGANNSGKTSAMLALRWFLTNRGDGAGHRFGTNDFTASHWQTINGWGAEWAGPNGAAPRSAKDWAAVLPALDVWLHVEHGEFHRVQRLLPTLSWNGGRIGVRFRLEARDPNELHSDFVKADDNAKRLLASAVGTGGGPQRLWPETLIDFLDRRFAAHFRIGRYLLDESLLEDPKEDRARPQALPTNAVALDGDPFAGLVRIDDVPAQRGLGYEPSRKIGDGSSAPTATRTLSFQLRAYYDKHLNPREVPELSDLTALAAIETAEKSFDQRLAEQFKPALEELQLVGYPGITDPGLRLSTLLRPTDGLDHGSAVQHTLPGHPNPGTPLLLPENQNGLGYQNLIAMVFHLMAFRDAWMRVGKAAATATDLIEPLHLVFVEEPEAHLHAQVQQVFIRQAYTVLRKHANLGTSAHLSTQLIVSTHSSHVAHEVSFDCLRYFRRIPAQDPTQVPSSTVVNLSTVFGGSDETAKFVTRYLQARHCDLFFADAAILVEGPAERMLIPHFMRRSEFSFLNQCYVTLLEIGGSHAHRLEPLIRTLGLLTLVVTDLDPVEARTKKKSPTKRGQGQVTSNPTLKSWVPKESNLDVLLNATDADKVCPPNDPLFAVRVAYQTPVEVARADGGLSEALPSTFEDSLVLHNLAFFESPDLEGVGLVEKFRFAITKFRMDEDVQALCDTLFDELLRGNKAGFALDVLFASKPDIETLTVPGYVAEGLRWLTERSRTRKADVVSAAKAKGTAP
jgi:predicted ATP-dependent endonuclease of OLD family